MSLEIIKKQITYLFTDIEDLRDEIMKERNGCFFERVRGEITTDKDSDKSEITICYFYDELAKKVMDIMNNKV